MNTDRKTTTRRNVLKLGVASACIPPLGAALWPSAARAQAPTAGVMKVLPNDPAVKGVHPIQRAILDLEASAAGSGVVELVAGTHYIPSRLIIKNRVTIRGNNGRTTEIRPMPGYKDSVMFEFRNPNTDNACSPPAEFCSQFSCRLENLAINARSEEKTVGIGNENINAVVWGPSWNEQCGLRNVLITEFARHAVLFEHGYGGTATFEIDGCEFMSANNGDDDFAALKFDSPNSVAYTNAILNHVIVSGPIKRVADYVAIQAQGRINLLATGLHVENCDHGVYLLGPSCLTAMGFTGSPSRTLNLITCASDFSGKVFGAGVLLSGASGYVLRDKKKNANIKKERNPLVFP